MAGFFLSWFLARWVALEALSFILEDWLFGISLVYAVFCFLRGNLVEVHSVGGLVVADSPLSACLGGIVAWACS